MQIINNKDEPQRVVFEVTFDVRHVPLDESHAKQILVGYLNGKGVDVKFDGDILRLNL